MQRTNEFNLARKVLETRVFSTNYGTAQVTAFACPDGTFETLRLERYPTGNFRTCPVVPHPSAEAAVAAVRKASPLV